MKLEKLSAWSEIISSIAILITLIYLAIQTSQNADQMRQNVEATKASTRQQMLSTDMAPELTKLITDIVENTTPGKRAIFIELMELPADSAARGS